MELNFHTSQDVRILICRSGGSDLAPNNAMSLSGDQMRLSTSSPDDSTDQQNKNFCHLTFQSHHPQIGHLPSLSNLLTALQCVAIHPRLDFGLWLLDCDGPGLFSKRCFASPCNHSSSYCSAIYFLIILEHQRASSIPMLKTSELESSIFS